MVKVFLKTVQIFVVLSLIFTVGCKKDKENINQPPTCEITSPQNNAQFSTDENITVIVVAKDTDGYIIEVQLYIDDVGYDGKNIFPYNFIINAGKLELGTHTLKAIAIDNQGAKTESTINITIKVPEYTVGMHAQGGIIAYVDNTGQHGLVAASQDQGGTYSWDQAVTVCYSLVLNGYVDWYLPTIEELNKLYDNKNLIGGFSNNIYWSSSEVINGAYYQNFNNGNQHYGYKSDSYRVRAVRAF